MACYSLFTQVYADILSVKTVVKHYEDETFR